MASRKLASSRDLKALVEVAQRFSSACPWEAIDDVDFVALELPGESEPWFANVLGCAGHEFGLYMVRGVEGMARMRTWLGVDPADEGDVREGVRQVGFTLERWSDLPPGHIERFARAGIALRRDARAPFLMVLEGKEQRPFDARSARLLLLAAATALAAHRAGDLSTDACPGRGALLTLSVAGHWRSPRVTASFREYEEPAQPLLPAPDPWSPPESAPPEVRRWRIAAQAVHERASAGLEALPPVSRRTIRRFVGKLDSSRISPEVAAELVGVYVDWVVQYVHRPRGAPSVLEALLDEDLPDDERTVLEARLAAHPTLVRFDVIDPETGWIEAEDVLTGESLRFHDQALSRSALPDTLLPVALVRVGGVVLPELRGPGLGRVEVDAAIAFLESEGLDISPAGLRKKPHLLGRLWQWRIDFRRSALPPRMDNTDGDPLEFIELLLRASDPDAVHAALRARDDIEYDEDDGTWVWSMENDYQGSRAALADLILLARIQFIGDELLVSVNSRRRGDRARAWLEEIPGVHFESLTARAWDEPHETPLDDRPTAEERDREVPPEMLDLVADHMRSYYHRWLDEKIPALGGKTPRQAARSKKGRERVALLIRTLDAPAPGMDVKALRQELLDELGLS